jgi:hypothetical protein
MKTTHRSPVQGESAKTSSQSSHFASLNHYSEKPENWRIRKSGFNGAPEGPIEPKI